METLFFAALVTLLVPMTIQAMVASRQKRYVMFIQDEAPPKAPALGCLPIFLVGLLAILLIVLAR